MTQSGSRILIALVTLVLAEPASADEVIVLDEAWIGDDLVDARDTTRAVASRTVEPAPGLAVLGDLLIGLPGVAVQRTGPGQGAPTIRGFVGSSVLVLVNGQRVNNAIFRPAPNQYTALVDPWAVERVDVVRGPGSTLFGSDALGGVINVITPLPTFDSAHWSTRGAAALSASSADRSVGARAHAATGHRRAGLGVGITAQRHDDLRIGGGERVAATGYDSLAADLTGHLDRGRAATTLWLDHVAQPDLQRVDELRPGFGQDRPTADEWRYHPSRRTAAHLRHLVRRPFAGWSGAELHLGWQRIDDGRRIRDHGDPITTVEDNRVDSVDTAARAALSVGGAEVTAGADYVFDRVASSRHQLDGVSAVPVAARFPDGALLHQAGVYSLARRSFGRRVVAQLGVRATAAALRTPAGDRGLAARVTALDWAGEAGASYAITDELLALINVGRGFRVPNVHDLSALGPRPGNRWQEPAAGLAAEHAIGGDAGLRLVRDGLRLEAVAFAARHDDRIDVLPTGEVRADGRMVVKSANLGTATHVGAEGSVQWSGPHGLALALDLSYVRGDQRRGLGGEPASEPADRMPPLAGGGRVTWRRGRFAVDARLRAAAAQTRLSSRDLDDPRIDPEGTPGFAIGGIGAGATLGGFETALSLDNLLDHRYREHGSGLEAPGRSLALLIRRAW